MAFLVKKGKIYHLGWRDDTGRERRKSLQTSNRKVAEQRLRLFESEFQRRKWQLGPESCDCSVGVFWAKYEDHIKRTCRPNTVRNKRSSWRNFLQLLQPSSLGDVTQPQVKALAETWVGEEVTPETYNTFVRRMRAMYNDAGELLFGEDKPLYNGDNPFRGVPVLRSGERPERKAMSDSEVAQMLQAACNREKTEPRAKGILLVVALGLYAGLRRGEIDSARWEWIDFNNKTITVRAYGHFKPKTRHGYRTIPLNSKLAAILKPHKKSSGYIWQPDVEWGSDLYRCNFRKSFETVVKVARVEWVTPHTMRHTWVTRLLKSGKVTMAQVSEWAGHSSIQVTVDLYGHLGGYDQGIELL